MKGPQTLPVLPAEQREFHDPTTGARLIQWTTYPAMHHHCYFTNPTISRDGKRLFGVTYRFRYPNLFVIDTNSGELRMLTLQDDINAFSATPDKAGERVFYSAGDEVRVVDVATGKVEVLTRFGSGRLGNCSLSHDDSSLAVGWRGDTCRLILVEPETGRQRSIVTKPEVGHIQFNPRDASLLEYSGPSARRIWTVRADGSEDRLLYRQRPDEWIVHESWSADGREVIFTHWPRALRAVSYPSQEERTIAVVNAWHAWSRPQGDAIVCDTVHPDRGLLLIDAHRGTWRVLCESRASSRGTQWREATPAAGAGIDASIIRAERPVDDPAPTPDMGASTYGPQWTHPHPTFAPDGRSVIFTSDRDGGWSHIYSVYL